MLKKAYLKPILNNAETLNVRPFFFELLGSLSSPLSERSPGVLFFVKRFSLGIDLIDALWNFFGGLSSAYFST